MLSIYWIFDRLDNMSTINIVLCQKQPQTADNAIQYDEISVTPKKNQKQTKNLWLSSSSICNGNKHLETKMIQ